MGTRLKDFLKKQVLAKVDLNTSYWDPKRALYASEEEANVITSLSNRLDSSGRQMHRLILDVDKIDVVVEESSSAGNYHVAFDKELSYDQWVVLMQAFKYAGIIEVGWYHAAIERGFATLRVPWVRKNPALDVDNRPRRVVY